VVFIDVLQVCHLGIIYEVEAYNNNFFSGKGTQTANSSWWPTASHWENEKACGLNLGHWTQWDEHWYLTRLQDIATGQKEGVPLSGNVWRNKLRGAKTGRVLNNNILDSCKKVFASEESH
jgi:hypothetical protein